MITIERLSPREVNMATKTLKPLRKLHIFGYIILLILVLIIAIFIYNFASLKGNAQLGASYAAHVTCSCRYIEGRSLEDCQKDFEAGMEIVSLSDDPDNKRMTAYVPFLAEAIAERRGEFGCIQLNEEEIDAL